MSNKSEATWHPNSGPADDLDATLARIDRLTAERDEARAERDALAHVIEHAKQVGGIGGTVQGDDAEAMWQVLNAAPAVSLARHDAEVKAQAWREGSKWTWQAIYGESMDEANFDERNPYLGKAE